MKFKIKLRVKKREITEKKGWFGGGQKQGG